MKVKLSSQNEYKMNYLSKVHSEKKGNRGRGSVHVNSLNSKLEAMRRLPKETLYMGKIQNSSIKQALNFVKRHNLDENTYTQLTINTQRQSIEDLIKKTEEAEDSPFTPVYSDHPSPTTPGIKDSNSSFNEKTFGNLSMPKLENSHRTSRRSSME